MSQKNQTQIDWGLESLLDKLEDTIKDKLDEHVTEFPNYLSNRYGSKFRSLSKRINKFGDKFTKALKYDDIIDKYFGGNAEKADLAFLAYKIRVLQQEMSQRGMDYDARKEKYKEFSMLLQTFKEMYAINRGKASEDIEDQELSSMINHYYGMAEGFFSNYSDNLLEAYERNGGDKSDSMNVLKLSKDIAGLYGSMMSDWYSQLYSKLFEEVGPKFAGYVTAHAASKHPYLLHKGVYESLSNLSSKYIKPPQPPSPKVIGHSI